MATVQDGVNLGCGMMLSVVLVLGLLAVGSIVVCSGIGTIGADIRREAIEVQD